MGGKSRNGLTLVRHDSPRVADDGRRERYNMKKYGIWRCIVADAEQRMHRCEITATSGKAARSRMEARYPGCDVLKMSRVKWLNNFSYAKMSTVLSGVYPDDVDAIMDVLIDCGLFEDRECDADID